MTAVTAKVTGNGQISLPAPVRHRWHAEHVLVVDQGEYVIVRPLPAEPLDELQGIYADAGPSTDQMRAEERQQADRAGADHASR